MQQQMGQRANYGMLYSTDQLNNLSDYSSSATASSEVTEIISFLNWTKQVATWCRSSQLLCSWT